jgi:hypothetical protein
MKFKTQKCITIVIVVCLFFITAAPAALALGIPGSAVPIESEQLGSTLGTGLADQAVIEGYTTALNACATKETALDVTNSVSNWALAVQALIGESATQVAKLKVVIHELEVAIGCRTVAAATMRGAHGSSVWEGQQRQRLQDENSVALQNLKKRKDEYEAHLKNATSSLWKAVIVKTLMSLTKKVAQKLVVNLSNKFKINDYLKYTDVVASQVYAGELLSENRGSNQDKAILRAAMQNETTSGPSAAVIQKAKNNTGFDVAKVDYTDPNFYQKMNKAMGSSDSQPYVLQAVANDNASAMKAKAKTSAQAEINGANGLKVPRTCSDITAQQKAFDDKWNNLNKQVKDLGNTLADLQNYQEMTVGALSEDEAQKVDQDIVTAKQKLAAAQKALDNLPDADSTFAQPMCDVQKGILSPVTTVDKGIDKAFGEVGKQLGNYNDNNLPILWSLVSDVANQIGTNLVLSGNTGSMVINENKLLNDVSKLDFSDTKEPDPTTLNPTQANSYNGPTVAGAFVSKAGLNLRGPAGGVSPRGAQ